MRNLLTTLAEIAGAATLCTGICLFSVPAGIIAAGVCLLVGGIGAAS
jgi:hypothetical protein